MASTYTTRNSIEKPALSDYKNTWGDEVNVNFDILDLALDGSVSKSATATLTTTQGGTNESQARIINYTGASAGTINIAAVEKWYIVRNTGTGKCTVQVTGGGGAAVVVDKKSQAQVYTDGTDVFFISSRRLWNEITSSATTSGTSKTIGSTNANLENYSDLLLRFIGVSHAGAGSADLRVGLGAAPGAFFTLGSFAASATVYGALQTSSHVADNITDTNYGGFFFGAVADLSAQNVASSATAALIPFFISSAGNVPDIYVDFGGETFDAGSLVLFGR